MTKVANKKLEAKDINDYTIEELIDTDFLPKYSNMKETIEDYNLSSSDDSDLGYELAIESFSSSDSGSSSDETDLGSEISSDSSTSCLSENSLLSLEKTCVINIYNVSHSLMNFINFGFERRTKVERNRFLLKNLNKIEKEIKFFKKICKPENLNNYYNIKKSIISFINQNTYSSSTGKVKQDELYNLYCEKNNISMSKEEFNNILKEAFNFHSLTKHGEIYWSGVKLNN